MSSAIGVPVVTPSNTPERISTSSASWRCEVCRERPVARRARSAVKSPGASSSPGGQPSTTQPMAGPCDSPKVVTRSNWPKVFDTRRRDSEEAGGRGRRLLAGIGERADARTVRHQVVALGDEYAHLPDLEQIGRASCRERVCQYV